MCMYIYMYVRTYVRKCVFVVHIECRWDVHWQGMPVIVCGECMGL